MRWVCTGECNRMVSTKIIRTKQQPRCAVRCIPAIKRRQLLVIETLAKEVSIPSVGYRVKRGRTHQLIQPSADIFASGHGGELGHSFFVLGPPPLSQSRRVLFHPAIGVPDPASGQLVAASAWIRKFSFRERHNSLAT